MLWTRKKADLSVLESERQKYRFQVWSGSKMGTATAVWNRCNEELNRRAMQVINTMGWSFLEYSWGRFTDHLSGCRSGRNREWLAVKMVRGGKWRLRLSVMRKHIPNIFSGYVSRSSLFEKTATRLKSWLSTELCRYPRPFDLCLTNVIRHLQGDLFRILRRMLIEVNRFVCFHGIFM